MQFKRWEPVLIPMTLWIAFKVVAFLFGFTPWPDIAQLALLGNTYPFISALGFGLWIGAASRDKFTLSSAIRNAFMVAFVVGFMELLLAVILINSSQSFVAYATSVYPQLQDEVGVPMINLVVSTWIGGMFVIVPAAAAGYLLLKERKR